MHVMDVRSIIALFLGLVIQFSQVPSSMMVQPSKACATQSMSCCEGLESCPCAKESESDSKPTPAIPAAVELKMAMAISTGSIDAVESPCKFVETTAFLGSQTETTNGFAGVPLTVAFCIYLI